MNDLIVLNNNEIAKNLTEYDEKMLNIYNYLGLPTENILVGVEERKKVFKNIEDVVDLLEPDIAIKSTYISKFLSAVSAGLFDAALNYLWDETVNQLRYRIAQYDIQYFFDLAVTSDKRNKLSTEADLAKIDDSELIQGAKEIGLISDIGYRMLDNIKFMRNWASAAHPNQVELTGLQLISWLETCIKEVISLPLSNITIEIRKLLYNIKNNEITDTEAEIISEFFGDLTFDKADSLCNGFFGIYCREDTTIETRRNIKMLLPKLWNIVSEENKWNLGIKFGKFQVNNDQNEAKLAREFLQIVDAESYLPDNIKVAELKIELEHLYIAHNAPMNNFYLEPPYAEHIKGLLGNNAVPTSINDYYIKVIIDAFLTNGNGICWGADTIYRELINKFSQRQFLLEVTSFSIDKISSKLQFSLCIKQYKELLKIAKANVTSPLFIELINELEGYNNSLSELRKNEKLMQKVQHLRNIIK